MGPGFNEIFGSRVGFKEVIFGLAGLWAIGLGARGRRFVTNKTADLNNRSATCSELIIPGRIIGGDKPETRVYHPHALFPIGRVAGRRMQRGL